jgi:hypothetical protein
VIALTTQHIFIYRDFQVRGSIALALGWLQNKEIKYHFTYAIMMNHSEDIRNGNLQFSWEN